MGANDHARSCFFARKARAHRKAAADARGRRQDVRSDAEMLVGIELASAGDPRLHLVKHEHEVMLVTGSTKTRKEFMSCRPDATLALDRFNEKTRAILIDR